MSTGDAKPSACPKCRSTNPKERRCIACKGTQFECERGGTSFIRCHDSFHSSAPPEAPPKPLKMSRSYVEHLLEHGLQTIIVNPNGTVSFEGLPPASSLSAEKAPRFTEDSSAYAPGGKKLFTPEVKPSAEKGQFYEHSGGVQVEGISSEAPATDTGMSAEALINEWEATTHHAVFEKREVLSLMQQFADHVTASLRSSLSEVTRERDRLRSQVGVMEKALLRLTNEVHGALSIAENEIRAAIGNANVRCLRIRMLEARLALAPTPEQEEKKS